MNITFSDCIMGKYPVVLSPNSKLKVSDISICKTQVYQLDQASLISDAKVVFSGCSNTALPKNLWLAGKNSKLLAASFLSSNEERVDSPLTYKIKGHSESVRYPKCFKTERSRFFTELCGPEINLLSFSKPRGVVLDRFHLYSKSSSLEIKSIDKCKELKFPEPLKVYRCIGKKIQPHLVITSQNTFVERINIQSRNEASRLSFVRNFNFFNQSFFILRFKHNYWVYTKVKDSWVKTDLPQSCNELESIKHARFLRANKPHYFFDFSDKNK